MCIRDSWEIYNENIVYDNSSHAIDYEVEDAENSTELFKTRDMMKVFLELSSSCLLYTSRCV